MRAAEPLGPLSNHSIQNLPKSQILYTNVVIQPLSPSAYSLNAAERLLIRTAQHNMRFRVYNDASYNFSDLARMYIKQNRYGEAKWFLLQSNQISRQENDDKHTIANLIDLATIKIGLGDYGQAQQDLTEARGIAGMRGFKDDVITIDKKMIYLKQNKLNPTKIEVRYAEAPLSGNKAGK